MAGIPFIVDPLALGTLTTGNQRAAQPAAHLSETLYRSMVWRSNGASNVWIRGNFATAQAINFVAILGANAQSGTTIRIRLGDTQAAVDGTPSYDSGTIPFIAPAVTRANGVYHSHLELPSMQTRLWWRIDIGGHTGDFEASMLVMGAKVQPARYYETNWEVGVRDLGSITFSRNGVPGFTAGAKLRSLNYKLGWLTEAEADAMMAPLDEALGKTRPFYVCFDPDATTLRQRRTFFGFNEDQTSLSKVLFNRFERNYQILSLF
jgi:hypothetical protein